MNNDTIYLNKDKNSIKIWPYLDDISQPIIPYSNSHLSQNKDMVVNLDFSVVKRINSSGAAITLMKLISILPQKSNFRIVLPKEKNIENFLQNSGFFAILNDIFQIIKTDLFENVEIKQRQEPHIEYDEKSGIEKISFPIFHLKYDKNNDRASVDEFSDWITDIITDNLSKCNIQMNTLVSILKEIAKNSQDHTKSDAFFGFDIVRDINSNTGELYFSFPDLGIGINLTVRNALNQDSGHLRADAWRYFALTDSYQNVFTMGFTTSKNPRNKGIGMSMIMDGTKLLDLDLTIWDGRSMLFVPEKVSHSELRRNVFDTGNSVGFYYYGRLKF